MRLPVKAGRVRDRILSNPKFQRWAAKFPLTKPVADRRASDLFDLCAGFVYSQIFYACVRLRILEAVAEETKSAAELAEQSGMGPDAMGRLLDGAVALSLLERRGDRYGLGRHGTSYIGNPGIADMVVHHAMFYRDLSDPVALLRGQTPTRNCNDSGRTRRTGNRGHGRRARLLALDGELALDARRGHPRGLSDARSPAPARCGWRTRCLRACGGGP